MCHDRYVAAISRARLELNLHMTLFRRLAMLGLFLMAAMPQAWAQIGSPIVLDNYSTSGKTLSLYGLTFSISSCKENGVTCSSTDGLVLEGVSSGRGTITVEVANATAGSAALSQTNGSSATNSLALTLTVSPTAGYPGSTMVSAATLTAAGVDTYSCSTGHSSCAASVNDTATFNGITISPGVLTADLANQAGTQTASQPSTSVTADNSFTVAESVSLRTNDSSSWYNGSTLQLNTLALKFTTTPEPASITILMLGLGGLAVARRRRRAS
jgi:hypothetical protein